MLSLSLSLSLSLKTLAVCLTVASRLRLGEQRDFCTLAILFRLWLSSSRQWLCSKRSTTMLFGGHFATVWLFKMTFSLFTMSFFCHWLPSLFRVWFSPEFDCLYNAIIKIHQTCYLLPFGLMSLLEKLKNRLTRSVGFIWKSTEKLDETKNDPVQQTALSMSKN